MWDNVLSQPESRDVLFQSVAEPEFAAESPSQGTATIRSMVRVIQGTALALSQQARCGLASSARTLFLAHRLVLE